MTTTRHYWQQLPKEEALVLTCARTNLAGATLNRAESLIPGLEWDRFKTIIHEHGVGSLIYPNIKRHFANVVPDELLAQLKQHSIATAQSNLGLLRELIATIQQLKSHNIECAVFKGLIVNQLIYRDLSIRKSGDIDILVRKEDYPKAKSLFIADGFRQTLSEKSELLCLQSGLWQEERRLQIDLHWGIPPRQMEINTDKIMDNLEMISLSAGRVPSFSQEDMFIVLCVNAIKEYWNQNLYPYCDIHEFMRSNARMNWDSLLTRAQELKCHRAVAIALEVVNELYDITLPFPTKNRGTLTSSCKLVKQELLRQLFEKDASGSKIINKDGHHLYYFDSPIDYYTALIDGLAHRVGHQYGKYFQPSNADLSSIKLPTSMTFLYYLIRPVRLAAKHTLHLFYRLLGK